MSQIIRPRMNQKKSARRGLLVAAFALTLSVCASAANALALNHSVNFNTTSELRGNAPRLEFNALLPSFAPILGTLRQVDLRYNFDLNLGITINNRTLTPVTADLDPNLLLIEGPRFFDRFNFNNLVASTNFDALIDVPAGTQRTFGSITLTLPGRGSAEVDIDNSLSRTSRPLQIRNIVLRLQGDVAPFVGVGERLLEFASFLTNSAGVTQHR